MRTRLGLLGILLCGSLLLLGASAITAQSRPATTIRWFGQSCFLITSASGERLITDPYSPQIGYAPLHQSAEIVLVSHEHFDHNAVDQVSGRPEVLREAVGRKNLKGFAITGLPATHGTSPQGQALGSDTIYLIEVDGLRIVHLGDLGALLSSAQIKQLGRVDILMVPVGGYYTIDAGRAWQVIGQLKPKIVLPMHYKTAASAEKIPQLAGIEPFIKGRRDVKRVPELSATPATLPKTMTVYLLPYQH